MREELGPTPRYVPVSERRRLITRYFNAGNDIDAALDCALRPARSAVSEKKVKAVMTRDDDRCLVCGSNSRLFVDHIRALENGGDNSVHNLAILCADCRKLKVKHDRSLALRRQSLCEKGP